MVVTMSYDGVPVGHKPHRRADSTLAALVPLAGGVTSGLVVGMRQMMLLVVVLAVGPTGAVAAAGLK